jgi:peptidoglycan/LPS O-acetylase OafA/YrhL
MDSRQDYRPDIDGLRAIAVLGVMAYHAFPDWLGGGYAGVDVFFVISGYLISSLLLSALEKKRFSLPAFYARRIRRLFPALVLVLATTLGVGWWLLTPAEFQRLGSHVAASAVSANNFVLFAESGYFDADAAGKPLLHLWSLGIEEQFYLFWPLLLALIVRHRHAFWLVTALTAASFLLNVVLIGQHPDFVFLMPLTRLWELSLGGMLALYETRPETGADDASPSPRNSNGLALAGLLLIALAMAMLHKYSVFPGWLALLPTLGAGLLIKAGPQAWLNRHVLASPLLVGIGLISYPLYLWHWPLLSFLTITENGTETLPQIQVALIAALLLATASYWLLEKPLRRRRSATPVLIIAMGIIAITGLLACGGHLAPRLDRIADAGEEQDWRNRSHMLQGSYVGQDLVYKAGIQAATTLFVGDSNMMQYAPRMESLLAADIRHHRSAIFIVKTSCLPIQGVEGCGQLMTMTKQFAADAHVDTIVIAASWNEFLQDGARGHELSFLNGSVHEDVGSAAGSEHACQSLAKDIAALHRAGKRVVIVLNIPNGKELTLQASLKRTGDNPGVDPAAGISRAELARRHGAIRAQLIRVARESGAEIVDPLDFLCSASFCPAYDSHGQSIYFDKTHLRNRFVREQLTFLDDFLQLPAH